MAYRKINFETAWPEKRETGIKILREGGTMGDLATWIGCNRATMYRYLQDNPLSDMAKDIEMARSYTLAEIHNALYKNAMGHIVEDEKETIITNTDGSVTHKLEKTKRHIPPNERAIEVYLRNHTDTFRDSDAFTQAMKQKELEIKEQKNGEEW